MITATGRALVEPQKIVGETEKKASFTVPITIVPSSLQQTYTIVDDEEVNQKRPFVFRNLEFLGALGTAATVAFGAPVNTVKALALFTGVIIPESKKVWPDRWPGYKRNIVVFAAPDLLKVPGNTIADHKLLFFSKRNLELLIADQTLFGEVDKLGRVDTEGGYFDFFGIRSSSNQGPGVKVVSIAFDSLDVRFEKVFDNDAFKLKQRAAALVIALPQHIAALSKLEEDWAKGVRFGKVTLSETVRGNMNTDLTLVLGSIDPAKGGPAKDEPTLKSEFARPPDFVDSLKLLQKLIAALSSTDAAQAYQKDLVSSPRYGLAGLQAMQPAIAEIKDALTTGADVSEGQVKSIETALTESDRVVAFYEGVAQALLDGANALQLKQLKMLIDKVPSAVGSSQTDIDAASKAVVDATKTIRAILEPALQRLEHLRPLEPVGVMSDIFTVAAKSK